MALIGEVTGSGGLTASGSIFISGSLQLSQETSDPTILENMGGAIYIKEDTDGANKFYFRNSANTVTSLGGVNSNNTWTGVNTFDGEITASTGLLFADDKKLFFGTDKDASVEYDEDGTNQLRFAGADTIFEQNVIFSTGIKVDGVISGGSAVQVSGGLEITGSDGGITIIASGSDGGSTLSGSVTVTGSLAVSGSSSFTVDGPSFLYGNTTIGSDDDHVLTIIGNITSSADLMIADDKKLFFGDGSDASIEYDEDGTDELRFAGAAVTFEQAVSFDGNVTLGDAATDVTTVTGQLTASNGGEIAGTLHLSGSSSEALRINKDDDDAREIVFESDGADKVSIYMNSAENFFIRQEDTSKDINLRIGTTNVIVLDGSESKVKSAWPVDIVGDLTVSGSNIIFGNDATDVTTVTGQLTASNGMAITGSIHIGASLTNAGADTDKFLCVDPDGELRFRTGAEVATDIDAVAADANITFTGKLTASNGLSISNLENPGSDVDKFLVSNSGLIQFRTGAEVASDIGATSTTATNNFTGDVTASQGLAIPDDTLLRFGNASGGDATIEYDEDGTDELRFAGAAVTFEQAASFDANVTLGNAATDVTTVTGQLTASNGVAITGSIHIGASLTNAGGDTDKFLCVDPDGEVRFRTGAEVASDIDAVAADANITFTGKVTASNGFRATNHFTADDGTTTFDGVVDMQGNVTIGSSTTDTLTVVSTTTITSDITASQGLLIADDQKLYFGTGEDASFEYDEDGNDVVLYSGANLRIDDDTTLQFGAGGDATIEYDENGTDELRFAGAAVTFEQAVSFDGNLTLGLTSDDVVTVPAQLTASEGLLIKDDRKLYFGDGQDWSIEYDEDGDDDLKMTGTTLTVVSDTITFTSEATTDPLVIIKNFTNDANGARLRFIKDKGAAGAANDVAGIIEFYADDANQDQVLFSEIKSQVAVHTNGQEGGKLTLSVASHDGENQPGLIIADGSAEDEVDVTLGNGSASRTTVSGDMAITTIANPGSDVDKFLVSNSGVIGFRTGAELASDIGATTTTSANNFTGDVTASQGLAIPDDTLLRFGNASGGDVTIEYDEDGTDELRFAGAAVTFEQAVSFDGNVTLGLNVTDVITVAGELTASEGLLIKDNKYLVFGDDLDSKFEYDEDGNNVLLYTGASIRIDDDTALQFGAGGDATIEYDENGTDELRFAGAAVTFEQAVSFDDNVTLGLSNADVVTVPAQLTASEGMLIKDDRFLYFGDGQDVSFEYDEDGGDTLIVSGNPVIMSSQFTASAGIAITGSIHIGASLTNAGADTDKFLCVDPEGELRFRTGAEVASDIGAVAADANITFSGKVTASNGFTVTGDALMLADGVNAYIGTGGDLALFHDGTDSTILNSTGDLKILSTVNSADAIFIEVDGGTSESIQIHSDQGTGKWKLGTDNSSIRVVSDVGGVCIDAPALNIVHSFSTDALTNAFSTDGDTTGTIIKYSPGADDDLTVGQLYFFHTDGTWNQADADAVANGGKQLLGIGLGNARTVGVLIKGFVRIPSTEILNVPASNASPGLPVYMSTTAGHLDFTAPSGNGDIVRIVGYAIQDDTDVLIYFDPDPTYVEVSA